MSQRDKNKKGSLNSPSFWNIENPNLLMLYCLLTSATGTAIILLVLILYSKYF